MAHFTQTSPKEYIICGDDVINELSPVLYELTIGRNAQLDVDVFHIEPREGCLSVFFRQSVDLTDAYHEDYILIRASADHTPEGRTSIGRFFADIEDRVPALNKKCPISIESHEYSYYGTGYYRFVED